MRQESSLVNFKWNLKTCFLKPWPLETNLDLKTGCAGVFLVWFLSELVEIIRFLIHCTYSHNSGMVCMFSMLHGFNLGFGEYVSL